MIAARLLLFGLIKLLNWNNGHFKITTVHSFQLWPCHYRVFGDVTWIPVWKKPAISELQKSLSFWFFSLVISTVFLVPQYLKKARKNINLKSCQFNSFSSCVKRGTTKLFRVLLDRMLSGEVKVHLDRGIFCVFVRVSFRDERDDCSCDLWMFTFYT